MREEKRVLVLCAAACGIALAYGTENLTLADSVATAIQLPEVNVTGRKSADARRQLSQTPIYNKDIMQGAPLPTVEAALRLSPAIDVRERGAKGVQTDYMVRGGSFDQVMVLLNGVNFTDARTGHQSHSMPIDMNIVGDISIIDGVAGAGAYAGAVDISTHGQRPTYIAAELAGGMHRYMYANLNGGWTGEKFAVLAAGSARHSGGYIHNSDFTNYNAYANARYSSQSAGTFEVQAGYQHRAFGANGFYSRSFPDQFETTSTALGSLRWLLTHNRLTLTANVSYRYNTDCFELIKGDESKVPFNHHITHNYGAVAGAAYDWGAAGETSVNIDYSQNRILSTVLGERSTPTVIGGITYNYKKSRHTLNALARHSVTLHALTLTAAGGVSNSDFSTDGLWSAGASYLLNPSWRLGAGAVASMRLPTFTDLYYTAAGYVSDPNLVPERATTINLSANFARGPWSASAYTYMRFGHNVIDWVKPEGSDLWHSMQVTRVNTVGAELNAAYQPSGVVKHLSISYGYIHQNAHAPKGTISAMDFDHLRNKVAAMAIIEPFKGLTLSLTATVADRVGNYSNPDGEVKPYEPYFLMDMRVAYAHGCWQLYVEDTNVTATRYYDFGGLRMPGSWVNGGLTITI